MKKLYLTTSLLCFASLGLISCGGSKLPATDLPVDGVTTPNPIVFNLTGSGGTFIRKSRIVKRTASASDLNTVEFYIFSDTRADRTNYLDSVPINGLTIGNTAPIRIETVEEVTGTCYEENPATPHPGNSLETCLASNPAKPVSMMGQGIFQYELLSAFYIGGTQEEPLGTVKPLTQEPGIVTFNTIVRPTFVLTDNLWAKKIRAVLVVGNEKLEFMTNVEVRDPSINDPGAFLGLSINNATPGKTLQKDFSLGGFNTRAPLQISTSTNNVKVEVKLGSKASMQAYTDGMSIKENESISIFVTPFADVFNESTTVTVKVGEAGHTVSGYFNVKTHAQGYILAPKVDVGYPAPVSATQNTSTTVRGRVSITEEQAAFNTQPDIAVTKVTLYKTDGVSPIAGSDIQASFTEVPAEAKTLLVNNRSIVLRTYDWSAQVPIVDGDNFIAIEAESNLMSASNPAGVSKSEPETVKMVKSADNTFEGFPPVNANRQLANLADVTVDPRGESPTLLMVDNTLGRTGLASSSILWSYPLNGNGAARCLALPSGSPGGLQFNHSFPELGGVFILTSYYNDSTISGQNLTAITNPTLAGSGPTGPQGVRHLAFSYDGITLYTAAQSRTNFNPVQQAFVAHERFDLITDPAKKATQPYALKNANGYAAGTVAKETTADQDAAKHVNNGMSIDIFTRKEGFETKEYILSLDGELNGLNGGTGANAVNRNNSGNTNLRLINVLDRAGQLNLGVNYDPTNWIDLKLKIKGSNDIRTLRRSNAIAIDDARGFAYIADEEPKLDANGVLVNSDNYSIWKVNLQRLGIATVLEAEKVVSNDGIATTSPFFIKSITSMSIEGLGYILLVDKSQNTIFAIDLITGERSIVVKGGTLSPGKQVCDQ